MAYLPLFMQRMQLTRPTTIDNNYVSTCNIQQKYEMQNKALTNRKKHDIFEILRYSRDKIYSFDSRKNYLI